MRKRDAAVLAILGLSGAAASGHWPEHAAPIEMAVYSVIAPGLLLLGLWSDRHRPRFWMGMSSAFVFHGAFLFLIRSYFPFSTIILVLPIAIGEDIALAIFMLKVLGY
jgi:hypothetical protein